MIFREKQYRVREKSIHLQYVLILKTYRFCSRWRERRIGASLCVFILLFMRPHRCTKHELWPIVTDVPWSVYLFVCLSVGWSRPWALQNGWTDRDTVWDMNSQGSKEAIYYSMHAGSHCHGKGHFLGVILAHVRTCPRSTFSTIFTRGQQRCGLWLPVYTVATCYAPP